MFYALVHITRKTASEKLAILKNYLKGDLADIVHGHGGGEQGYKDWIVLTVKAKIKLRELGVRGLNWDDPVTGNDRQWWEQYFCRIDGLKEVEIPRCLFPDAEEIETLELHTFADASGRLARRPATFV